MKPNDAEMVGIVQCSTLQNYTYEMHTVDVVVVIGMKFSFFRLLHCSLQHVMYDVYIGTFDYYKILWMSLFTGESPTIGNTCIRDVRLHG